MPPSGDQISPAAAFMLGIVWLVFMVGMATSCVLIVISFWRLMKAHERIADKLKVIAEKLQIK